MPGDGNRAVREPAIGLSRSPAEANARHVFNRSFSGPVHGCRDGAPSTDVEPGRHHMLMDARDDTPHMQRLLKLLLHKLSRLHRPEIEVLIIVAEVGNG